MTIIGYQFDKAKVTALKDSILYHHLGGQESCILKGYGQEMRVTTTGLTATVQTGLAVVCGRLIEVTAPETVKIPVNSKGYLVLYIDLSQENVATGTAGYSDYTVDIKQVSVRFVTALTQQDILQGGLIYTFNLGAIRSTTSSVAFTPNEGALAKRNWRMRREIDIGYGAKATLYRYGDKVRLELNSIRTSSAPNSTWTQLIESIPSGYRPRCDVTFSPMVFIGSSFQNSRDVRYLLNTNGTIFCSHKDMNAAPLHLKANVEWYTNDVGVESDVY